MYDLDRLPTGDRDLQHEFWQLSGTIPEMLESYGTHDRTINRSQSSAAIKLT